jgi:CubicO group peptidase (beta-lactamase class C family)
VSQDADEPVRARVWTLPRCLGPVGLICSTPADVLGFARLHLTGGLAPDGTGLLTEASAAAMTDLQADLPDKYTLGDSWGLGWIRFGWNGRRLIGHDSKTIRQSAFLRLLPDERLAVTLLTNGGSARDLYVDLYREIFAELADVDMPRPLASPAEVEADHQYPAGLGEMPWNPSTPDWRTFSVRAVIHTRAIWSGRPVGRYQGLPNR